MLCNPGDHGPTERVPLLAHSHPGPRPCERQVWQVWSLLAGCRERHRCKARAVLSTPGRQGVDKLGKCSGLGQWW